MNMTWTCSVCGSHEKRFSAERRCEVCLQCGHKVLTDAEYNDNLAYEKTIMLAKENLQVGHWNTVIEMIEPLCKKRPAEKQLYLMLLMAVTKGYEDYLLNDYSDCYDAERYWDHLARLHCINGAMADYARRRRSIVEARQATYESRKALLLIASLTFSLIALCTLAGGEAAGILFLVLAIAGWIWVFNFKKPGGSYGGRSGNGSTDNPFR